MSPRESAPPAGVLNLWITASSKNLIKVLDRPRPITPVCAHARAHVPFCILFGGSQIPSHLSVAPGPQLDVSGLPPSGNRCGWDGYKCPLSSLEPSPGHAATLGVPNPPCPGPPASPTPGGTSRPSEPHPHWPVPSPPAPRVARRRAARALPPGTHTVNPRRLLFG